MDVVGEVDEIVRLKIRPLESGRERTISIPICNRTDRDIRIETIEVSCGCMAAIAKELTIPVGESTSVYLRVTPTKIGQFAKRTTIHFMDGHSIVAVVESDVMPRFSITPARIGVLPGSKNLITVKSNFSPAAFTVESPDPLLVVDTITKTDSESRFALKFQNADSLPQETEFSIVVRSNERTYEYRLRVNNLAAIKIKPETIIAYRRGGALRARVVIWHYKVNERPFAVEVVDPPNERLRVAIDARRKAGEHSALYDLLVEGDVESRRTIDINWLRGNDTVAASQIIIRP